MNLLGVRPSFATGFAQSPGESEYPELWRGLVAAYDPSLGQTGSRLIDWSGKLNHGTFVNDTHWVLGPNGWVLEFPGSEDYVTTLFNPNKSIGNGNPFTIIARVFPHDVSAVQHTIIGQTSSPTRFYLTSLNSEWFWGIGSAFDTATGCPATANVWQDIGLVYEGGSNNVRMYRDGVEKYNEAYGGDGALPDDTTTIGIHRTLSNDFDGLVEFVYLYNRVLIPAEISLLHQLRKQVA